MKRVKRATQRLLDMPTRLAEADARGGTYIGGTEVLTRLFNGQKMYVDTRDISETPHLIMDGHWEIDITRVFEKAVVEGEAAIDVGATYGYYGMIAGGLGAGTILCVDPNPVYGTYLTKNLTVNGLIARSIIEEVAIGAKKGSTELMVLADDWASSTIQAQDDFDKNRNIPYSVEKKLKVDVVTIDALVKKHTLGAVGVLKLDIEGFEEAAYPAMENTIRQSPNLTLLLEFSPENYTDPKEFFNQITRDFTFVSVMPAGRDITPVTSYSQLEKVAGGEWMMLVASQRDLSK